MTDLQQSIFFTTMHRIETDDIYRSIGLTLERFNGQDSIYPNKSWGLICNATIISSRSISLS